MFKKNDIRIDGDNNYVFQGNENLTIVFDKDFTIKSVSDFKTRNIIKKKFNFNIDDELVLYYPYFELETKGLIAKVNHELFLKTLSLLANKILLPPSHLLETNYYNINLLKQNFYSFFYEDIFITSLRNGQSNINEFIDSKKNEAQNWTEEKILITEDLNLFFPSEKN